MICRSRPSARACSSVIVAPELTANGLQPVAYRAARNCSMVTSVAPILAKVERPKPRKMSPMPQIAKLTTSTVTTAAMMDLPIQPEDACRIPRSMNLPYCEQRGFRVASPARARARIIGRAPSRRNNREVDQSGRSPIGRWLAPGRSARRFPDR